MKCNPGTLPINQQIESGQIIVKALPNEFGQINLNGENLAYFNYNDIYSSYSSGDTVFFFYADKSKVIIKIGNDVKQYPDGVISIAFNLHAPKKTLSKDDGSQKGTKTDMPPAPIPMQYSGTAINFSYVINDCGDLLVMEANPYMTLTWSRCKLVVISAVNTPVVYGYNGADKGEWTP